MPAAKTVLEPWPADQPLPSLLSPSDLRRVLGVRPAAFYKQQRAGRYRCFEVAQPLGVHRYSGHLVDRYRRGESIARIGPGARRSA